MLNSVSFSDTILLMNLMFALLVDSYLKGIINPFLDKGVDFLWIDDNNKENTLRSFTMNYFLYKTLNRLKF